jgi:RNA recognition motif-containing protein
MASRIMSETGYTVQVTNLSGRVSESDLHEFFSFSGPIEHIELIRCSFYSLYFFPVTANLIYLIRFVY